MHDSVLEDFCGEAMGRGDYSTFAENYRTLFIEEVPKFVPDLGAKSVALSNKLTSCRQESRLASPVRGPL